jgi:predicted enzyme related to lactoylglutathione lyase
MSTERTYPAGVTSWIDVEVGDLAAAQDFYGDLFGWTFETATPPDLPYAYVIAWLDGQQVAGLTGPTTPASAPGAAVWRTYVAVDDIEATCAAVERAGGQVIDEPADAGQAGRWVNVLDPSGAEVSLWQAKSRLGAQLANVPGAWNFSDLRTPDPEAVKHFYEQVFGWVFVDLGFATMIQVPGYGDHLAATSDPDIHERQATAPPGFADVIGGLARADDLGPHWHVTFTVADRDESAARAESLGATVLERKDSDWTKDVTLRDPQGAVLTASQFTPPDSF